MEFEFLPPTLVPMLHAFITGYHKQRGYNDLILHNKEVLVFSVIYKDLWALQGASNASFKGRRFMWLVGLGTVVASIFFKWWIIFGLIIVIWGERYFAKKERGFLITNRAIILALEVMVKDVAGWGACFPEARTQAQAIVSKVSPHVSTQFLDIYLDHLNDQLKNDSEFLAMFAPPS